MQEITGVNRKQLSNYLNSNSKPSKATTQKIAAGLKQFQKELSEITLA